VAAADSHRFYDSIWNLDLLLATWAVEVEDDGSLRELDDSP
jgi:hypothetical protein